LYFRDGDNGLIYFQDLNVSCLIVFQDVKMRSLTGLEGAIADYPYKDLST
jgi:hypothetical protein